MFSKRPLPEDREETAAEKRFRLNLSDVFSSNLLSGARVQSLFTDAHAAHAMYTGDLADPRGNPKHASRNLRRRLLRRSQWPKIYYAQIRLWSPRLQRVTRQWVGMLPPHEIMSTLAEHNSPAVMLQTTVMGNDTKDRLRDLAAQFGIPNLAGFGLWGDGVPVNWDRSESVEILSFNMPGIPKLRIPITGVSKKFWVKHETMDDLMAVVQWSAEHLLLGTYPTSRHDGSAWMAGDKNRKKLAGKSLGIQACCVEVRADWAWYQSCLRFPQWNENEGCCYKCWATKKNLREVGADAPWRSQPLSHWDLVQRWLAKGCGICPLFSCPGVTILTCIVDWLHCMDLGVAAVFLGNLFYLICPKLAGSDLKAKCVSLFHLMLQFYNRTGASDRYQTLIPTMLKQPKKTPKLRGKGAEVRGLVKFGVELAEAFLDDNIPLEATAKQAAKLLSAMYDNLSHQHFNAQDMQDHARRFSLLQVALEDHSKRFGKPNLWKVLPKLHMMLHLAESGSCPADAWTYRDEDFGGAVGHIARRRGGKNSALATSRRIIESFCAKHKVPRL